MLYFFLLKLLKYVWWNHSLVSYFTFFFLTFSVLIVISDMNALSCIFQYAYTYMYGINLLFYNMAIFNFFVLLKNFCLLKKKKKLNEYLFLKLNETKLKVKHATFLEKQLNLISS